MAPKYKVKLKLPLAWLLAMSLIGGCKAASSQALPGVVLKRITNADGSSTLADWSQLAGVPASQKKMLTPDWAAYSDARLYYESSKEKDPRSAAEEILALNKCSQLSFLAEAPATSEFVRTIDGHDEAAVTILMFAGKLSGSPAKAITYVWTGQALCGELGYCSVVHTFMAPDDQFEGLGGGATLAVAWLQQDVPDGVSSMKKYGDLAPQ